MTQKNHQTQQGGWIAVSDRLPNPDVPVLAGCLDGKHFEFALYVYTCIDFDPEQDDGYCYTWQQCSGIWCARGAIGWCDTGSDTESITHWQPLPEPPVQNKE